MGNQNSNGFNRKKLNSSRRKLMRNATEAKRKSYYLIFVNETGNYIDNGILFSLLQRYL